MRTPVLFRRLDQIHSGRMGDEKWALGIFERGEKKMGDRMYLYSKSNSRRAIPRMVREAMLCRVDCERVGKIMTNFWKQ